MKKEQGKKHRLFFIGVIIIVVSFLLGLPVLFLTATMAVIYGPFWLMIGGVIYAISWVILGAGFLISGVEGIRFVKQRIKRVCRKCEK